MTRGKNDLEPRDTEIADFLGEVTHHIAHMLMRSSRLGMPKTAKALANVNKVIGWEIADLLREEKQR
jgi:predicted membrane-bound spermidine synthase